MVGWLLLGALALPTLGAALARVLGRGRPRILGLLGSVTAVVACVCALALAFLPDTEAALGRYALFVPARVPVLDEQTFAIARQPTALAPQATATTLPSPASTATTTPARATAVTAVTATPPPPNTATASASPTASATATRTATPSNTPTFTATPSATVTPSVTATPSPAATATATPRPRTYVVRAGDTLRSIAERFDISVAALLRANNLTPAQADALRQGRELIIPAR